MENYMTGFWVTFHFSSDNDYTTVKGMSDTSLACIQEDGKLLLLLVKLEVLYTTHGS